MNPSIDPFDELAALFLTEPDAVLRGQPEAGPVTSELLLVGHLPVRASVWMAPYADALARTAGPTALLRLDDTVPHLQVLRGPAPAESTTTLRETIRSLRNDVRLWIIRPSSERPLGDLVECGPSRITILTGADEAALVAAYQTIKKVAAAAEDAGRPLPALGISVMGSDETTAQSAVKRLNQTTHSFLGVEISLVLCLPRMDAGMISSGYRRFGERCPALTEVLRWIGEAPAEAPAAAPPRPVAAPPAPQPLPVADDPLHDVPPVIETVRGTAFTPPLEPPAPGPVRPAAATDPPPTPAAPPMARLVPKAHLSVEPKQPTGVREPDEEGRPVALASHVEGLTPLPVRCPGCEDVEFAVDGSGRVHLLAGEQALRRIAVVRRWAFEHRELVALACPTHVIDLRQPVRVHLFTAAPLAVADLHATEFMLHVLAPVQVGDRTGWYTAPLNKVC